jgi:hypothetical protein
MSEQPLQGKVLGKAVAPVDALGALREVVAAGQEYLTIRQQEMTKRAVIGAYQALETERIQAAESILKAYFEQAFQERAKNFEELLQRMDDAAAAGDSARVSDTLKAIVSIAQASPLNDVGDLSVIRKALDDPDHVWKL